MKTAIEIILVVFLGLYALVVFWMANANKARYLEKIIFLESFIKKSDHTKKNFYIILGEFENLQRFDMDKDRTQKLFHHFCQVYMNEWIDCTCRKDKRSAEIMSIHNSIMAS